MYQVEKICVDRKHPLFPYLDHCSHSVNNLYNASLFRIKQCMTGLKKEESERYDTEKEVLAEIENNLDKMNKVRIDTANKKGKEPKLFEMPTSNEWMLNYYFLDGLFKATNNPDYRSGIATAIAQPAITRACSDMNNFFKQAKDYKANPSKYLGRPKLPRYKAKGGACTFTITNSGCKINKDHQLKFPKTEETLKVVACLGHKLKEVKVRPDDNCYWVIVTYEVEDTELVSEEPTRICAIDLGVDNLIAMVNNCGLESFLINGGGMKSLKEHENIQLSEYYSRVTIGTANRMKSTKKGRQFHQKYARRTDHLLHCAAKWTIDWCLENNIDTIVVGANKGWKQESNMGHEQNRKFGKIPYDTLKWNLKYRCQREGIRYIEQEESYTSKASFLDKDVIPVYGKVEGTPVFSGRRVTRGMYKAGNGNCINADLNGAANIGRKKFPELFSADTVNFNKIKTVKL